MRQLFRSGSYVSWLDANIDVFGLETREPAVAQIRCPLYACYGTNDEHGTAADLELIRRNATSAARVDTQMFEGADHLFTGHEADLAAALAGWIDSLR